MKARADEFVAPVTFSINGQPHDESKSRIEYLQREIGRLLLKNETMRFELFAIRNKIARIDRTLFDDGSQELLRQTPLHLISILRELCNPQDTVNKSRRTPDHGDGSQDRPVPPK
jgi:hypothetical protein